MTEDQVIELARLRLDDRAEPYLWSDEVILDAMRSGMQEAADRAKLLRATEEVALVPQVAAYTLTLPVLDVLAVRLETGEKLGLARGVDIDPLLWSPFETGTPTQYVILADHTLAVYPAPDAAYMMAVDMYRGIQESDALAVIPERYHRDLVWWIAFECFAMKDADGEDSPRAQYAYSMFERRFGPRKTAVYDRVSRDLPAGATLTGRRIA